MLSRLLARLVLAAALLAAWQGALVHPLEHVNGHGGFVHLADGHDGERNPDASGLCDALAALTACAFAGVKFSVAVSSSQVVLAHYDDTSLAAEAPPFLSQGPPQLS
jgi:hypothetical protein